MSAQIRCVSLSDMLEVSTAPRETVLCLGNFDGVHLAHRRLIRRARERRDRAFPTVALGAFCFSVSSAEYLFNPPPARLSSLEDKLRIFREEGVEYVFLADFPDLCAFSAERFATEILRDRCHAVALFCGFNYRFGAGGRGTPDLLTQTLGISTDVLPEEKYEGQTVSSTRIRHLLQEGDAAKAAQLLTEPYSFTAEIRHGKALGRRFGIPTVNQEFPPHRLVPRHGVYLTRCKTKDGVYFGLSNVGVHPTVDRNATVNCETYLLDFSGDLYGQEVTVEFLEFLRSEQRFSDTEALYSQIGRDLAAARAHIARITSV